MTGMTEERLRKALVAVALAGLVAGGVAALAGRPGLAEGLWAAGVVPVLAALAREIVAGLRAGSYGLDIVAALSMSAALAVGETLAAAVVALMYAGGNMLEVYAQGRARAEMHALLERVPRSATRHRDGGLEEVALDAIAPGDLLLIAHGAVLPVDGDVEDTAVLDCAALTGEAEPQRLAPGAAAMSGATNAGAPFDLRATRPAAESTYAGIVRLVSAAQASRAPMARLADRWALAFLGLTLALAGAAWGFSGDPVRAVAVLVVATPCPLILAVPVAWVAGLSRAARFGVLVKGARPLEALARARIAILDKTGTLTDGRPGIVAIRPEPGFEADEVLGLAAALDQASTHPVAAALVAEARARGLALAVPEGVEEAAGEGLTGRVDGRRVAVGGRGFVAATLDAPSPPPSPDRAAGEAVVAVAIDGAAAGEIVLADGLREGTPELLAGLRALGFTRLVLATGDRAEVAEALTAGLGLDAVHAELTPEAKVALVRAERAGGPVLMVGDGVNDAPALAAADVGVAMGARGAAASAEAAEVVLLVDQLDRLLPGLVIARGARAIALQSVAAGIGLSTLGMLAAAAGWLSPVEGALLQEAIDVAVILNALRALAIRPESGWPISISSI